MSKINHILLPNFIFFYLCKKLLIAGLKLKVFNFCLYTKMFRLLKKKSISTLSAHNAKLYISVLDSGMASPLILQGKHDEPSLKFLRKKLKKNLTIVDIGAHVGFYSTFFKKNISSGGKLYCFEPDDFNFSLLKENIKASGIHNVVLEKMAVSDKSGTSTLYSSTNNFGDHHLYFNQSSDTPRTSRKVYVVSIDNYFNNKKIHIDFVKIDVQGMEPLVIKGMNKLIKHQKHISIFLELWPKGYAAIRYLPDKFIKQLIKMGFKITAVTRHGKIVQNVYGYDQIKTFAENEEFLDLYCEK